ncbi:MAG: DMT family transporter [Gammaproteobacteria bacterium]
MSFLQRLFDGQTSITNGIILMLFSTLGEAVLLITVRTLSNDVHPFELAFFRNFFALITLLPWFMLHGFSAIRTRRPWLHLLRASTNVSAMLCFFTAVGLIPLAQVQALGFTAPLFATLLAALLLGETVRLRRWIALIVGFIGALLIIRPGVQTIEGGALLVLLAAGFWGFTMVVIKILSRTESALTITVYMGLLMTPLALLPALFVWTWPSWQQLALLGAGAVIGTLGQLAMAQAFRVADVTVVLPLDFTKLIWAALLGYLLFAETIDNWTVLGAVVIFTSVFYIALREHKLRKAG